MGLVLKHVQISKAGTLHYRRKIPKDVREIIGKGEFKRLLGATQREALIAYPRVNAEFERQVVAARKHSAGIRPAPQPLAQTSLEAYAEAKALLVAFDAPGVGKTDDAAEADWLTRSEVADDILAKYRPDPETGYPSSMPEVERLFANGLRNNGEIERPIPTLEDAKRLYLKEKIEGDQNEATKRARIERVMGYLSQVIEKDRPLSKLERSDAREVRDHMLKDLAMKPATVRRYMNDIRALVTHGLTEFGVRGAENPFLRLSIKIDTVARDERKPFTADQLHAVGTQIAGANDHLRRIWRILEGTGCRLGEVTGLLVSDVRADAALPYIDLKFHRHRRLKNAGSVRRVPLIGDALAATKEALEAAGKGPLLFARYGGKRGADAASAALMKHVRVVTTDPKVVVHSLRHTMEDRLIRSGADEFDRNLILGHRAEWVSGTAAPMPAWRPPRGRWQLLLLPRRSPAPTVARALISPPVALGRWAVGGGPAQ